MEIDRNGGVYSAKKGEQGVLLTLGAGEGEALAFGGSLALVGNQGLLDYDFGDISRRGWRQPRLQDGLAVEE